MRPTKLTPALQDKVVQAIVGGNFREVAAHYAGIPAETLSRWMSREGTPYCQFRQAVLDAEAVAEIRAVAMIIKAGQEDPKHLEWWLERKFPDRWGRRERFDVNVRHYAEQMAADLGLSTEELLAEATRIVNGKA